MPYSLIVSERAFCGLVSPVGNLSYHTSPVNTFPCDTLVQVVLSIVNFSKTRSLYRHGMSPVVRSAMRPAWHRIPARNTYYYKSPKHENKYVLSFAFVFDQVRRGGSVVGVTVRRGGSVVRGDGTL